MNRLFKWGIIVALLVLVASGLMAIRIIFVDKNDAEVPAIIGMSAMEATNQLQNAGLSARIDFVDSDQSEGTVISQSPLGGDRTEKGKIVIMRVSRGGAQARIPDVRGMEFAVAVKELDTAGFKIGTVLRVPDAMKAAGTVIAQNPASPAMVQNNRMIELLVSEGQKGKAEMIQVPDLKGQPERLARQILQQSELTVARVVTVESDQVPEGTVMDTQPRAGARVPNGNAITLRIAKAPSSIQQPETPEVINTEPNVPQQIDTQPQTPPSTPERPFREAAPIEVYDPNATPAVRTPTTPPVTAVVTTPPPDNTVAEPTPGTAVAPGTAASSRKTAKIRYQVPPLTRPLSLKISITDELGTRVLRDQQARGGEYMTMDIQYTGPAATVTVNLGGEQVWQEKYN